MLSVGTIIGGAIGLVRNRFGAVLAWGAIYSLVTFAIGYLTMLAMAPMDAMGRRPDPAQALANVGGFLAKVVLFQLVIFLLYAILLTAAQRAVLRPEESGFASLRLGRDELRMAGLAFFLGILFFVFYLVAAAVIGLVAAAVGLSGGGPGAIIPVAIVGALIIFGLLMFFWVRVSLAFPLTLMRRRFVLAEAWRLSRGHFWVLFGGYLVLTLIVIVVAIGGSFVVQGSYWSQLISGGFTGPAAQQAARSQMAVQFTPGWPMLFILLLGTVSGALMIAFTGGAIATAARVLASDQSEVADTFA